MTRVLVADDEGPVRTLVKMAMQGAGHEVVEARDGREALDAFAGCAPDLVILDVMMPKVDGFEVCARIREHGSEVPVLFLSAKGDETDKVFGLGLGADDYLAKPFGTREFLARVETLLRRRRLGGLLQKTEPPQMIIRIGRAVVNGFDLCLTGRNGARVPLTQREFNLLQLLNLFNGQIVPRESLVRVLWGHETTPNSHTLEQHLYTLRQKVEGNGFVIQTIPRCGVRLEVGRDAEADCRCRSA